MDAWQAPHGFFMDGWGSYGERMCRLRSRSYSSADGLVEGEWWVSTGKELVHARRVNVETDG